MRYRVAIGRLILVLISVALFQIFLGASQVYASYPTLTAPQDGAYIEGNQITFSWSSVIEEYPEVDYYFWGYRLVIGTGRNSSGQISGVVYDAYTDSGAEIATVGIFSNDGTTYYWGVEADYTYPDPDTGVWVIDPWFSGSRYFVNTWTAAPERPALSYPLNGGSDDGTTVCFSWDDTAHAQSYFINVYNDTGMLFDFDEVTDELGKCFDGFSNDGRTYTWNVQAWNNRYTYGLASYTYNFINAADSPPAKPGLTSPLPGATYETGGSLVYFSWNAAARAAKYHLEIFDDRNIRFAEKWITDGSMDTYETFISGFGDDGRTYSWIVTAVNAKGPTISDKRYFTNYPSAQPDKPELRSPGDKAAVSGTTITFEWTFASRALDYKIDIIDCAGASFATATTRELKKSFTTFKDDGGSYTWQVTARNPVGNAASDTQWTLDNGVTNCTASVGTGQGVLDWHKWGPVWGTPGLNTCMLNDGSFFLKDVSRNPMLIITEDASIAEQCPLGQILKNSENDWTGLEQRAGVDAHAYAGIVYNHLRNKWLLNSYDGRNSPMKTVVNSDNYFNNAAWLGDQVLVGVPDPENPKPSYAGSLSILAHEWGHAVTDQAPSQRKPARDPYRGKDTTSLFFVGESGILDEAFSDWMGITIERANGGTSWTMLEGINQGRNIADPTSHSRTRCDDQHQAAIYNGDYWHDMSSCMASYQINPLNANESNDWCYRHCNNGVPNKMFYLLSVGTQGEYGGKFNNVIVQSLGIETAMDIAYKANTKYWSKNDLTFVDAMKGMKDAAAENYGGYNSCAR